MSSKVRVSPAPAGCTCHETENVVGFGQVPRNVHIPGNEACALVGVAPPTPREQYEEAKQRSLDYGVEWVRLHHKMSPITTHQHSRQVLSALLANQPWPEDIDLPRAIQGAAEEILSMPLTT